MSEYRVERARVGFWCYAVTQDGCRIALTKADGPAERIARALAVLDAMEREQPPRTAGRPVLCLRRYGEP